MWHFFLRYCENISRENGTMVRVIAKSESFTSGCNEKKSQVLLLFLSGIARAVWVPPRVVDTTNKVNFPPLSLPQDPFCWLSSRHPLGPRSSHPLTRKMASEFNPSGPSPTWLFYAFPQEKQYREQIMSFAANHDILQHGINDKASIFLTLLDVRWKGTKRDEETHLLNETT